MYVRNIAESIGPISDHISVTIETQLLRRTLGGFAIGEAHGSARIRHANASAAGVPVPTVDLDPVVVVCTGCGNPLPTTAHTEKLLDSPPCPTCIDPAPADFEVLGELCLGHEDEAPESGVYLITDNDDE